MTEFHPDCTINLHVESMGKPDKLAWCCSLVHAKRGQVVLARKHLGFISREEAELKVLRFGLDLARRFLQEKVVVAASFSLDFLESAKARYPRGQAPELKAMREAIQRDWAEFRLKRAARLSPAGSKELSEATGVAFPRKGKAL